jgi:HEPN domain-containing protein
MTKMKIFTRQDGFSETELLHSAIDHLASAKVLFDKSPRCYDSAGYLCHLGIELVLKAIILNKCDGFPDKHSLGELSKSIERQSVKLNYGTDQKDTISMLDGFYELRYPKPSNPIEIGDDDWERIKNLFDFLILMLPEEIKDELKEMGHFKKGNRILMERKKKDI